MNIINYKKIFQDAIELKYPEKRELYSLILEKEIADCYDVLRLNKLIFGAENTVNKHKSYDVTAVMKVLKYQQENNLTNIETAKRFNLSRNTVSAWKRKVSITPNT
jgi:hypothetical protein